jgi:hypothetical protein
VPEARDDQLKTYIDALRVLAKTHDPNRVALIERNIDRYIDRYLDPDNSQSAYPYHHRGSSSAGQSLSLFAVSCTMSVIRNALSYIVVGSGVVLTAGWTGLLAYAVLRLII